MNKIKFLVLFTVFIDIVGLGIIIPILPFYVESFNVNGTVVTLLFATYAFFSFFSAPLLGTLSDRFGRRWILIGSITSSAIGWIIFASAPNIIWLFVGRIIDGIAAGNISTAQSALSDIAPDEKTRASNMGLIGAIFGIAFIVGPAIGGALSFFGTTAPFWFVGILSALNAIMALFFFPETIKEKNLDHKISFHPLSPIITGLKEKELRKYLIISLIFGTAVSVQQSVFSLFAAQELNFDAKTVSFMFVGMGLLILFNQAFLLRKVLLKYFNQKDLMIYITIIFMVGMFLMAVPVIWIFIFGLVFSTFGQSNLRAIITSAVSELNPSKRGQYIGITTSVTSLAMIIGPILATIAQPINIHLPFIIAGVLMFGNIVYLKMK